MPRDGGGAAPQLRHRPGDEGPRRQPRHLHPPVREPRRRALLVLQLPEPAEEHDELVRERRGGRRRPDGGRLLDAADQPGDGRPLHAERPRLTERVGRRPQPQPDAGHDLGRATSARRTRATARCTPVPARRSEPEAKNEAWIVDTFSEHQVLQQHPHVGRLLHVGARLVPADPRDASGAEHRHREVLLRGGGDGARAHQGVPRQRGAPRADGPDRGRALLRGRQLGRRQLLPEGDHRLLVRGRLRPLRQRDPDPARGRAAQRASACEHDRHGGGRLDHGRLERGDPGDAEDRLDLERGEPEPERASSPSRSRRPTRSARRSTAGRRSRASGSSPTTRARASTRRTSSPRATSASSRRRLPTAATRRRRSSA